MEFDNLNIRQLIKQVLNEDVNLNNRNKRVKKAYNQIVSAVAGFGTNPTKVLAAIKTLQGPDDFVMLKNMFSDKRTGYNRFEKMVNSEYDSFNLNDINKLYYALNAIGVNTAFNIKRKFGTTFFNGGFTIKKISRQNQIKNCKVTKDCQNKYKKELTRAVTFWKNWLKDPITQQKVQKNWDAWYATGKLQVAMIFPMYFNLLNNLQLVYYHCGMPDYTNNQNDFAFVRPNMLGTNKNVYVNCSKNDTDIYGTLIHEIQLIIYGIKPLNPEKKLNYIFVKKNTIKDTVNKITSSLLSSKAKSNEKNKKYSPLVVTTANKYQVDPQKIDLWLQAAKLNEADDPGYVCSTTEKMSNIMTMRKLFNIQPGGKITLKMLLPYIKRDKIDTNIEWYLMCWALKGFPDLQTLLNKTNDLALTQTNTNTNIA